MRLSTKKQPLEGVKGVHISCSQPIGGYRTFSLWIPEISDDIKLGEVWTKKPIKEVLPQIINALVGLDWTLTMEEIGKSQAHKEAYHKIRAIANR